MAKPINTKEATKRSMEKLERSTAQRRGASLSAGAVGASCEQSSGSGPERQKLCRTVLRRCQPCCATRKPGQVRGFCTM
ncbi:hypothetical protein CHARACLAT_001668 [Characodon lateralis]|uniref:Uncharacterized protein n=1 Tax=Characodon lateralis TaxID=208331 RepID=A0ABU7DWU5_9TELE|nr:hypothetical protein [Characodon lateralis]